MLLLVADTSGKHGSVGLACAGDASAETQLQLIDAVPLAGGTFSAQLVPQIAGLLEKHGFRKAEIDAFIVISGPGSFTGLRVGLAAIKALAEILQKPIVPVSLLEVVALSAGQEGKVLATLDAGRGELYAGQYDVQAGTARVRGEHLLARGAFVSESAGYTICTPEPSLAQMAREAGQMVVQLDAVTPEMIARVGLCKLQAGETVSPEELEANYIRRSDAEIFSKASH